MLAHLASSNFVDCYLLLLVHSTISLFVDWPVLASSLDTVQPTRYGQLNTIHLDTASSIRFSQLKTVNSIGYDQFDAASSIQKGQLDTASDRYGKLDALRPARIQKLRF